ncbi:MAG TPA: glycosyltransferase [Pyrinomonadaceae bacterium]
MRAEAHIASARIVDRGPRPRPHRIPKKLKILWFAYVDYNSGNAHGGNLRLFNYAKELVRDGHEAHLVVMKRKTDDRMAKSMYLESLKRQQVITDYLEVEYRHPRFRGKLAHLLFFPTLKRLLLRKDRLPVTDTINEEIVDRQIDVCLFSSRDLLFVLPEISKSLPTIIDWVDSYVLYHSRQLLVDLRNHRVVSALKSLWFLADALIEERYNGKQSALNLTVSRVDKRCLDFVNGRARRNRVLLNGVEPHTANQIVKVRNQIIFTGTMDFPPNYESAIWFIDHVFPLLRKQLDVKLVIAGANPVAELIARGGPHIEVKGYVEDLRHEIAQSELYVAPLVCGSGFKNKVLEAIASGTFVAGTSMAVEFLSPEMRDQLIVADTPQELADSIIAYLRNPKKFAANLETLQRIATEEFSWKRATKELVALACEAATAI